MKTSFLFAALAVGMSNGIELCGEVPVRLEPVAEFPNQQVTGVAVSREGRMFVNFPFWSDEHRISVAEVTGKSASKPFPDEQWNRKEGDAAQRFVCVQSVRVDDTNTLWVLDAASPKMAGVVAGGPKLVKVDLAKNQVAQVFRFGPEVAMPKSYLNDVRVDTRNGFAFITDSGEGALIVLNLRDGQARRLLSQHRSVKPEAGVKITVEGHTVLDAEKKQTPQIAADGIALDADGGWLYYKALTSRRLNRIRVADLENEKLIDAELTDRVEEFEGAPIADGLEFRDGVVWITAVEENAIARFDVARKAFVAAEIRDPRLKWPDSMAWGPDDVLYVTTSQIHLTPKFNQGKNEVREPYRVWKAYVTLQPTGREKQLPGG
jgi:sugar lactone lactonase YvrE